LALYAKRAEMHRPPFAFNENEISLFENGFPYEETNDQMRAINDILKDLKSTKPMDRLVCGDVGFGKTEVAMRAAFFAVQARKQVAVLAPTTVLTFQHFETFKKRFEGWPVDIRVLNRFVTPAETKKTLQDLKDGKVDLIVGTHKLLGSTVGFKDLGLLIIDEEQKFGVTHKEKIKKIKTSVVSPKICMICGLLKARVTRSAVTVESFPPLKETNISVILKFSVTLLIYPFASSTIRLYRSLLHKIKRSICSSKY
jgi:transcription-repair coupling factor (superfamily II helicase)